MTEKRNKDGTFKKGSGSPNPKGRTPGQTAAAKLRKVIEPEADAIIQTLIKQAKEGDVQSAKALLDKVLPNLKASSEPVQFNFDAEKGLTATGDAIVQNIADGVMPLDSGSQLISSLAALAKMKELDELTKRIEALEEKQ